MNEGKAGDMYSLGILLFELCVPLKNPIKRRKALDSLMQTDDDDEIPLLPILKMVKKYLIFNTFIFVSFVFL